MSTKAQMKRISPVRQLTTRTAVRAASPMPPLFETGPRPVIIDDVDEDFDEVVVDGFAALVTLVDSPFLVASTVGTCEELLVPVDDGEDPEVEELAAAVFVDAANIKPGVRGCVARILKSSCRKRICMAGPTVAISRPDPVASAIKPHTPPRKSVTSVVHVCPLGTQ